MVPQSRSLLQRPPYLLVCFFTSQRDPAGFQRGQEDSTCWVIHKLHKLHSCRFPVPLVPLCEGILRLTGLNAAGKQPWPNTKTKWKNAERSHISRQGPIFSLLASCFRHLLSFHSLQVILWPSFIPQWDTNTELHKQAGPPFHQALYLIKATWCVAVWPISISPIGLSMCTLKLPPTRKRDVILWCCSKSTISHISALLSWAAALPCNMVI